MSSQPVNPSIQLTLSSVGFKGADLDSLAPDFETDYDVSRSLKWFPSFTGPETWLLILVAAIPLKAFVDKFGELLAEDVYAWAKGRLSPFFKKRPNSHGTLVIELESVVIYSDSPIEVLTSQEFVNILALVDATISSEWRIEYVPATNTLSVSPEKDLP